MHTHYLTSTDHFTITYMHYIMVYASFNEGTQRITISYVHASHDLIDGNIFTFIIDLWLSTQLKKFFLYYQVTTGTYSY